MTIQDPNLVAAQATEDALRAQDDTLTAELAAAQLPRIRDLLYKGFAGRIIGHTELSMQPHAPGVSYPHPVDYSRAPGYDQHNPTDVAAHCKRLKALGLDVLMFNCYKPGGFEDISLAIYLKAVAADGLNVIINIDKGVYEGAAPLTAIQNYLVYIRKLAFTLSVYEKWNGKFIVTFFALPSDDPKMFATLAADNPDIVFVNNVRAFGGNQMSWVSPDLWAGLDGWCTQFATDRVHLNIPHVSPGFNDTWQGHSVWSPTAPARVYPAGVGPNLDTLKAHFGVINKHYGAANPLPYLQLVTVNDWDELTAMEQNARGLGGYFANQ